MLSGITCNTKKLKRQGVPLNLRKNLYKQKTGSSIPGNHPIKKQMKKDLFHYYKV